MTLRADHISEETPAFHAFIGWARQRLEKMDAQLQLATIAAEVAGMEAFATGEVANGSDEWPGRCAVSETRVHF
jgi:hypothetical protein